MASKRNSGFIISAFLLTSLIINGCTKTEKTFWENGKPKSVIQKKGRHYNGLSTWYYEDGIKQHECNYVNDTLQGTSTRWYNNGKVSSIDTYKNNCRHGKSVGYDYDGKLTSESNYVHDTLDGLFKEYYSTGQVKIDGSYQMGLLDGKWLYYQQDGTIVGMGEFNKGNGKQRAWYPDGTIKRLVQYKDNVKHGQEILYDVKGNPEQILVYENGELIRTELQSH
jgi:uncharacterized protein